jgi:hypothetical protein
MRVLGVEAKNGVNQKCCIPMPGADAVQYVDVQ